MSTYLSKTVKVSFCLMFFFFSSLALEGSVNLESLIEEIRVNYEKSIADIDHYVMVANHQTVYYKKFYDNGRPYFKSRTDYDYEGDEVDAAEISEENIFTPEVFAMVAEKGKYEGTANLNGKRCHQIFLDDLDSLMPEADEEHDIEVDFVRMYVDVDDLVIRKMELEFKAEVDGETRNVSQEMLMEDFRNVSGMLIPHRTLVKLSGISAALSEEERKEAEENIREFERQLADMPEAQRKMVERMAGSQIAQFREMLEMDEIVQTYTVEEVRVNTGEANKFFE